jgi:hypothetical protein
MSDSEPKKPTTTVEPNRALRALAGLLGRQLAGQLVAQNVIREPATPGDQDCPVCRSSDATTKPT